MALGADYSYQNSDTSAAQTEAKLTILDKKDPALAKIARALFGNNRGGISVFDALQSVDKVTRDRLQGLFAQEIAQAGGDYQGGGTAGGIAEGITGSISGFADRVVGSVQKLSNKINDEASETMSGINRAFKPVSTALGQTIGNVSNLVRDPLGTITLIPGSLLNVMERNNPRFAAKLEATYKKYKIDQLPHLPSMLAGSIAMIDAVITLPFIILADLYQGLIDIIQSIAEAIDRIVSSFIKLILENFLDGIILDIINMLNDIADLAAEIQGIANIVGGVNIVSQWALNIQVYATQLGSFLSNPLDLLFAYAPPQVSEALYLLRNPQQLINNILPPELTSLFARLAQITGFGFNGNMGYGFVSVLEGLKGGVISSILTNFADQYPILTPLLGMLNRTDYIPSNSPVPPTVEDSPVNPTRKVVKQGVTQPQTIPEDIIKADKEFLLRLEDPIAYIRSLPPASPAASPPIVARSSGSQQPSVILKNLRAGV